MPRAKSVTGNRAADHAHRLEPRANEHYQRICTECGTPFNTTHKSAKTCKQGCRTKRSVRRRTDPNEFSTDGGLAMEIHEKAHNAAMDDIPEIARKAVAEVAGNAAREAMTVDVLESIRDMLGMMPVLNAALADALGAANPVMGRDGYPVLDEDGNVLMVPDYDRRLKAAALVMKYTVGQPGLAPQVEAPEAAGLIVNFGSMPPVSQEIEGTAAEIVELEAGQRQCDICAEVKPADEFVGASSRCADCHSANETRARAAIAERTRGAGG